MKYLKEKVQMYYPYIANQAVDYEKLDEYTLVIHTNDSRKHLYDLITDTMRMLPIDADNQTDEEFAYEFSLRLRKMMLLNHMGQTELSEATGISQPMISRYSSRKSYPDFRNLDKIARALNCSIDDLRYIERRKDE